MPTYAYGDMLNEMLCLPWMTRKPLAVSSSVYSGYDKVKEALV
jgi:hypothetical protein